MASSFQKLATEADKMIEEFVQDWIDMANLGYSSVDKSIDEAPRDYWLLALAGNLGWAVAGFFPITAAVKVIVIGNAVLGAGAADKVVAATKFKPPSVDKVLAGRIAETADALEKLFLARRSADGWQLEIALLDVETPQGHADAKLMIWGKMFPGINYEKRRQEMLKVMTANIESQVKSFKTQWAWWKKNYYKPYTKCMDKELEQYPVKFIGLDYKSMRDRCFAAHPDTLETFSPVLDFPLVVTENARPAPDGRPTGPKLKSYGSFPVPADS